MHASPASAPHSTPPRGPRPRIPGITRYEIRDRDGTLVAIHHRRDDRDGKRLWWTAPDDSPGLDRPVTALPLYRSETLRDAPAGASIVVVEGERAADALGDRSIHAVATVTGAATIPDDPVLESLRGYYPILWPDADVPGRQHMQRIAARLHALGIPCQIYDPWPACTDGSDAADLGDIDNHILLALIILAPDWAPPAPAIPEPEPEPESESEPTDDPTPPRTPATTRQSAPARLLAALGDRIYAFRDRVTRQLYVDIWIRPDARVTMPLDHGEGEATATILAILHHQLGADIPSTAITRELIHRIRASVRPTDHHRVSVRTAHHDGAVYIDLAEPESSAAIAITRDGWEIVRIPDVRFVRRRTMEPLPRPERHGSLASLRALLGVDDDAWTTVVAWMLAALAPDGPYPILAIEGPPGASKSTTARILRAMIDPSAAPLIAEPRDGVDLMIAAAAARILAIDNLPSTLPAPMVDALCRLATDGAIITRQLYSDGEITVHRGARPIILTSVGSVLSRGDLADRALPLVLDAMPDDQRIAESEIRQSIAIIQPTVIGALADAVAYGLAHPDRPQTTAAVRMLDACLWSARCAPALGIPAKAIIDTYQRSRAAGGAAALDADPIGSAIIRWAQQHEHWIGTCTELLQAMAAAGLAHGPRWPHDARALGRRIRMLRAALATQGVIVEERRRGTARRLEIRLATED